MVNSALKPQRRVKQLLACGAATLIGFNTIPLAYALPPGGAGADTPGTSSSVSPSTVEQCGTLNYHVDGYPAGETVNIKIDNGAGFAGDSSVQGQGVIARQRIDDTGTASGSIEIPCDLPPGEHFLRYLATEGGNNKGYTNSGNSYFHVVERSGQSHGSGADDNSGDSGTSGNAGAATDSSGNADTPTASTAGTRNGGSRVATTRGGASNAGNNDEETVYVDEQTGGQSAAGSAQASGSGAARASGGGGAVNAQSLDNGAAKPKSSGAQTNTTTNAAAPGNSGIFDKNKAKEQDVVQAAAAAGPNSTPYVGFFIGLAILLVGMTAINAWLLIQFRKRT